MAIPISTLMPALLSNDLLLLVGSSVMAGLFSWFRRRREETSATLNRSFDGGIVIEEPERLALREEHGVRPLTEEEEGTGIDQLPEGVYGFTSAVGQWDAPLFRKKIFLSYEMHKLRDGSPVLIGYVSSEDAERMRRPTGTATIRLFPDRQDDAPHLVCIPLEQIRRHKQHSERTGRGLELELEPRSN
ncbi:MAG: hypothetical protein N0A16_10690 [Blastocatellia bacterium]|nr:hypothetical protein [Blastocatellia bacterium]MCS7158182.1 hypothetical protein [Blastocatellia bacterium]MCX7752956.1 hypothetical protein [Blastocatellia bacterium]MDW8168479.1 hypothetical protein [Acidobacteriota bacterium]MDW8256893.1 hypothetical protein [Acidobacteriota bacterium]